MISNNEKNKQIEKINIYTLTTSVQKTLLHNLYFLAKKVTFFKIAYWAGQNKLHTTMSNGF